MTDAVDFKGLELPQLREAANAFAVEDEEVIAKARKPELLKALNESGVTWPMYLDMFYPDKTTPPVEPVVAEPVVDEVIPTETPLNIITKEERPKLTNDQYLIKMVRENPLFEFVVNGHKHRFTTKHPYVLMSAEDADVVLQEDGFRQARPSEVSEYYN